MSITLHDIGIKSYMISSNAVTKCLVTEREQIMNEFQGDFETTDATKYVHKLSSIFDKPLCRWLIYESETFANNNGGWTTSRHRNYPTTDLPVKEIRNINKCLINIVISKIFPLIEEYLHFNKFHLNIKDLFIVKYEHEKQNCLGFHRDGGIISFNILLNSPDEFEGGGTTLIINDTNKTFLLDQGDMLLHIGVIKHSGNKITKGIRYILVGFIGFMVDYNYKK